MKKLLIISVLCGFAMSSYSHLMYFFPDTNAYFSVSYMKFWFQGDTVIEDLKYKKVYMQSGDSIADFNKARYFSAIREDTIAEKVYYFYEEKEYLLYDFSVSVGDIVKFYSLWCWWTPHIKELTVKNIDSVLVDNHYRKRVNLVDDEQDWNKHEESWIEGIGSTNGLFFVGRFDVADAMDWTRLLCVHIDGKITYQDPDMFYDKYNCYIPMFVNIIENKEETLKIYPTITDNFLYIETDENIKDFNYKIISVQGQIISGGILANIVNVSNLSKGFYFVVISNNKNIKYKIHKFVKL